jgi:small subunit ribosomal protein S7
MPRRRKAAKREILPDPKFGSTLVTQFVNALMLDGKKSKAESAFYGALDRVEEQSGQSGLTVFKEAVNKVRPVLEVKSRRVGGSTYQVPVEVRADRRTALAIRWIIQYSRARVGHSMAEKLAAELSAAARGEGLAVKKREDTHRMADANKAFSNYRW